MLSVSTSTVWNVPNYTHRHTTSQMHACTCSLTQVHGLYAKHCGRTNCAQRNAFKRIRYVYSLRAFCNLDLIGATGGS